MSPNGALTWTFDRLTVLGVAWILWLLAPRLAPWRLALRNAQLVKFE